MHMLWSDEDRVSICRKQTPQKKEHLRKPRTFLTVKPCTRGRNFDVQQLYTKYFSIGCLRAKAGGTWGCAGQVSRDRSPGAENAAALLAALWRTWTAPCSSCTLSTQPPTWKHQYIALRHAVSLSLWVKSRIVCFFPCKRGQQVPNPITAASVGVFFELCCAFSYVFPWHATTLSYWELYIWSIAE